MKVEEYILEILLIGAFGIGLPQISVTVPSIIEGEEHPMKNNANADIGILTPAFK